MARKPAALDKARLALSDEVRLHEFLQWVFAQQWAGVRGYVHERDIQIVGDLAIFVAHDSADVWAHRELFALDEQGNPTVVAGVPPDSPFAGMCPPFPGRCMIARATITPATPRTGRGHQTGGPCG